MFDDEMMCIRPLRITEVIQFKKIVHHVGGFLGKGGGTGYFSSDLSSDRKDDIKLKETIMEEELGTLVIDPETNLPMDPLLAERSKIAKEKHEGELLTLGQAAKTAKEKSFAELYKMGATTHGVTASKLRGAGQGFQTKFGESASELTTKTGDIETEAIGRLEAIKDSIRGVKNIYGKSGTQYGGMDMPETYNVESLGGDIKPRVVQEEMYDYDYLTGKRKGENV